MDLSDSEPERAKLDAALDDIQQQLYDMVPSRTEAETEYHQNLSSRLVDEILRHTTEYGITLDDFVPMASIGYDVFENAIGVGIHHEFVTEDSMQVYAKRIRGIVGDEVGLVLYNSTRPDLNACSRTGTCEPVQGGVKFTASNGAECTVGYKATYHRSVGFVTAGHCVDGLGGTSVGQPGRSNPMGIVYEEKFNNGSTTYCDCAFIQMSSSSSSRSMSSGILGAETPTDTGRPSVHKLVKMSGQRSGVTFGAITSSVSSTTIEGTIVRDIMAANYLSQKGDSGAPVIIRGGLTAELLGINVATTGVTGSVSLSYFVPVQTIESSMSGISWGF